MKMVKTICRVCFASGVRLHAVNRIELKDVYEKLANNKLQMNDEKPKNLCYVCYTQLRRCYWFSKAVKTSEALLSQVYHEGINGEVSKEMLPFIERVQVYHYSISPVESVDIVGDICDSKETIQLSSDIKPEVIFENRTEDDIVDLPPDIKIEVECEFNSNEDLNPPEDSGSDPEDNVPLNSLKKTRKRRQKRQYTKSVPIDASVTTLSIEQQRAALALRAASENYLQSPYRCTLCYRGFVNHEAFTNHQAKHDERRGAHECGICRFRYRSARLLRTHTSAAHAHTYTCNKCGHRTHTKDQASEHERWHNGHTYQCQLCSMKFAVRTSYLTHVRATHAPTAVCRACGGRYLSEHGLRMHQAKAHAGQETRDASAAGTRYCTTCDIQFWSRRAWAKHIATDLKHTQQVQRTKQCPICLTDIQGSPSDHMKEHSRALRRPCVPPPGPVGDVVRLTCDQCDQCFGSKAKLTAHIRRVHLGVKYNKNIVCEVCGKKCTSNATLKYHQRKHTGERPHQCPRCSKRFIDTNQLRIHARTHTGERPYECAHCGKRFAQKPALNRHYRVHTGAKPYTCEVCSKSFSQSNSLKLHVRSVHLKMPSYRRKTKIGVEKSGTNVGLGGTNAGLSGTNVGLNGTNVGLNGTSVGDGSTNVGLNGTSIGDGGTNAGLSGTNVGLNGTSVGDGSTNVGLNGTSIGDGDTIAGLSGTNVGLSGTDVCASGTNVGLSGTNVGLSGTDVCASGTNVGLSGTNCGGGTNVTINDIVKSGNDAIKIAREMIKQCVD